MDFIRDIFVNLLSNAIWVIGGFMLARFLFLKKSSYVNCHLPFTLKKIFHVAISDQPQLSDKKILQSRCNKKKSIGCDLIANCFQNG
jgi:hypothetical protein